MDHNNTNQHHRYYRPNIQGDGDDNQQRDRMNTPLHHRNASNSMHRLPPLSFHRPFATNSVSRGSQSSDGRFAESSTDYSSDATRMISRPEVEGLVSSSRTTNAMYTKREEGLSTLSTEQSFGGDSLTDTHTGGGIVMHPSIGSHTYSSQGTNLGSASLQSIQSLMSDLQQSQSRLIQHLRRAKELVKIDRPTVSIVIEDIKSNEKQPMADRKSTFPCRARGMPSDHDNKTAILIVKPGTQHGDPLPCSHLDCKKRGIRFVYCGFCEEPVAKGNFSTRHSHPGEMLEESTNDHLDVKPSSLNGNEEPLGSTSVASSNHNINTISAAERFKTQRGEHDFRRLMNLAMKAVENHKDTRPTSPLTSGDNNNDDDDDDDDDDDRSYDSSFSATSSEHLVCTSSPQKTSSQSHNAPTSIITAVNSNATDRWTSLLDERPQSDDSDHLMSWLRKVVAYSEGATSESRRSEESSGVTASDDADRGSDEHVKQG